MGTILFDCGRGLKEMVDYCPELRQRVRAILSAFCTILQK
ncbi:hypothetical protein CUJ84_Chr003065 [Rhizobium leguminosarum]|uniref:Uncharacterized protein n=1 Tax=Rhizobium leguminosarum TaxID=384 RepID=A0A2K9Z596_RHILE|nr:hypothetical protein CUJ84_Chr003065 [Rhizobium leguminosarum]